MKPDVFIQKFENTLSDARQETEDRRTLSGKYAPEAGQCRVCKDKVVAKISYPNDGMIGGPPSQGYISGWSCVRCFIMYGACPPRLTQE